MWWNNVETKPYGGYPQHWDVKILEQLDQAHQAASIQPKWDTSQAGEQSPYGTYNGMTISEAAANGNDQALGYLPDDKEWRAPNFYEDTATAYKGDALGISLDGASLPEHQTWFFYLQRICNHCTHPACKEACPRQAIEKREEDGIVYINEDRCRGYRFCMEACPYKKIYFNHVREVSQKCIFCFPRVDQGVAPACARMCPGRVRFAGYLTDEEGPIHKLVNVWKVAIPLHPEYGTQPNVYYVPPIAPPRLDADGNVDESQPRIPDEYLEYLFGPAVHDALAVLKGEMAKTRAGEKSELLDILISRRWLDMFHKLETDPATLEWTGRA
jgi:DMSO reductase family type II enzyme iron-sulfur subunit